MASSAVDFESVSKIYRTGVLRRRSTCAVCDVTLSVPRGSVFGVIGPNRAGKTTLLKLLLSICRPTSGAIVRLGRPVYDPSTLARVGYLHENQAFPRYLTPTALLRYYGGLSMVSRRELDQRVPRLLDQVGLADRAGEPISLFSKGMVQRLALAQAIVNDPELLVLDEPTEGMDLAARKLLHDVIRRRKAEGKTAILVSHNLSDIQRACDLVAVVQGGRAAFTGSLADFAADGQTDVSTDALQQALEPLCAGASP